MRVETAPHTPQLEKALGRQERRPQIHPDGASEVSAGPLTGTEVLLHPVIPEGATATTAALRASLKASAQFRTDTHSTIVLIAGRCAWAKFNRPRLAVTSI